MSERRAAEGSGMLAIGELSRRTGVKATTIRFYEAEGLLPPALRSEGGHRVFGLAHLRPQPKPLLGRNAGFLDDLFVDPSQRGLGVGRRLIEQVAALARERQWVSVRWITAPDNAAARRLYDALAVATSWVTYELKP